MKRFVPAPDKISGMEECPGGPWVRYEDAACIQQGMEDLKRILYERNQVAAERDCLIARLEHKLEYALAVAALHGPAQKRIAELEAAIDKLAQCKGRFHTEANYKALIAVREKNLHK